MVKVPLHKKVPYPVMLPIHKKVLYPVKSYQVTVPIQKVSQYQYMQDMGMRDIIKKDLPPWRRRCGCL